MLGVASELGQEKDVYFIPIGSTSVGIGGRIESSRGQQCVRTTTRAEFNHKANIAVAASLETLDGRYQAPSYHMVRVVLWRYHLPGTFHQKK